MTKEEAIKWLGNLIQDIGQMRHQDLWDYAQALSEISQMIDEMPDIVRCEDCEYSVCIGEHYFCDIQYDEWGQPHVVKPDGYCDCGERKKHNE